MPASPPNLHAPRYWPSWMLLGSGWIVSRLPLSLILDLGKLIGRGLFALAGALGASRRQITERNLALCFPALSASEQRALARRSFEHTAMGALELTLPWLNPARDLTPRISLHGLEHLQAAQARGRGVLLVGAHFTAIDIISQGLKAAVSMDVIYRRNRNPVLERLQLEGRRRYFDAVIERKDMRQCLKRLKAGHIVWYAPDQDYGARHSVFAPFFGVPAATITATTRLAAANGSAVLFMSHYRHVAERRWSVHFGPVLEDFPSGDALTDATRMNGIIEAAIEQDPAQYLWMHRRFKTRPPGEPSPYL